MILKLIRFLVPISILVNLAILGYCFARSPKVVNRIPLGKTTSVVAHPNDGIHVVVTRINATRGSILVEGSHPCPKDKEVTIAEWSDGRRMVCVEGQKDGMTPLINPWVMTP